MKATDNDFVQKRGFWNKGFTAYEIAEFECSCCGKLIEADTTYETPSKNCYFYCPWCGAKMS